MFVVVECVGGLFEWEIERSSVPVFIQYKFQRFHVYV